MPEYRGKERLLFIETPLGADAVQLDSFTGEEGISQLFSFQLELLSEDPKIKFETILGQKITFGVQAPDAHVKRSINGVVTAFTQLPPNRRMNRYRAVVSPQMWGLTRKFQSRIFQNKNVGDILRDVFKGLDAEYRLTRTYQNRDYCVQYRETDFNFASRLMEEEGIFYFFKHADGSHKLIISDDSTSNPAIPGQKEILFEEVEGGVRPDERITDWQKTQHWASTKTTLREYDFLKPKLNLNGTQDVRESVTVGAITHKLKGTSNSSFEVYDYAAGVASESNAPSVSELTGGVKSGIESLESGQFVIQGDSSVYWMTSGHKFNLAHHFNGDGEYLLTRIVHSGQEGDFYGGSQGDKESHYSNQFECIPAALKFRPGQVSEKPHVWGCQTAVVVGPAGEEIYTEEHGRIKVQFHWDRDGKKDADSSCWVRVATLWAGKSWGMIHIPRIGQEVVVDFLEGDPDRPIVVGSVYNADMPVPWALPTNKTQSGILTRSSMGGSPATCNEFRFEDKKGSEQVYLHAEKNQDIEVENDETHWVGHDRKKTIDHDETVHVKHDRTTTIDHDEKVTINHDRTTSITNNDKETVTNKQSITVVSDQDITIGGKQTITIASNKTETITGSSTCTIVSSETKTTTGSRTTTVAGSDTLTALGGQTITTPATITITAGGGVTITAPMVTIAAAMVQVAGVIQCTSLIAAAGVVSPAYTPGAGNMI